MDFKEYRIAHFKKWQKIIINMFLALSILIFVSEILMLVVMVKMDSFTGKFETYIPLRIIYPSSMNFISVLAAYLIVEKTSLSNHKKNFVVSIMTVVVSATPAIFHNFFKLLLGTPILPFLLCSIFADKKLLRNTFFVTIPFMIASFLTLWFDSHADIVVNRILYIFCIILMITCAYLFSISLVKSQRELLDRIYSSYRQAQDLISELRIEPLTKLYNRVSMNEAMENVIKRAEAANIKPFAVVIDLDFFKNINDTYGHSCGDEVLVALAEIIKNAMGGVRKAFRFGGEEFLLLFDNESLEKVYTRVEVIRLNFYKTQFDFAPDKHFTLSAGIASYIPGMNYHAWFNRADEAMYKAKAQGRNQTILVID